MVVGGLALLGFEHGSQNQRYVFANASPEGRGCREAAGEGYKKEVSVVPLTRPAAAGHPLPLGEGFTQETFSDSAADLEAARNSSHPLRRFEVDWADAPSYFFDRQCCPGLR